MSKVSKNIYNTLRTSFLIDETAYRNWGLIIIAITLSLFVITSVHRIDSKVIKISALNKKNRELRAEYIEIQTILMKIKMESNIVEKVKWRGIYPSKISPQKIKVINTKD